MRFVEDWVSTRIQKISDKEKLETPVPAFCVCAARSLGWIGVRMPR